MLPPHQDAKLKEILERFVKSKKSSDEVTKELCLYICFRLLTDEGNFETEDSAHTAFILHYHDILVKYYQRIIYPGEETLTRHQRGYILKKIKDNIWNTVWIIHSSPEVSSFLLNSDFSFDRFYTFFVVLILQRAI